jgi:hypothetical protein
MTMEGWHKSVVERFNEPEMEAGPKILLSTVELL